MVWTNVSVPRIKIIDVRTVDSWKSYCRKCSCHHPFDSKVRGFDSGCICNPSGRRGACGRYVPTDNLEFLEYMSIMTEGDKTC